MVDLVNEIVVKLIFGDGLSIDEMCMFLGFFIDYVVIYFSIEEVLMVFSGVLEWYVNYYW